MAKQSKAPQQANPEPSIKLPEDTKPKQDFKNLEPSIKLAPGTIESLQSLIKPNLLKIYNKEPGMSYGWVRKDTTSLDTGVGYAWHIITKDIWRGETIEGFIGTDKEPFDDSGRITRNELMLCKVPEAIIKRRNEMQEALNRKLAGDSEKPVVLEVKDRFGRPVKGQTVTSTLSLSKS